jgi:siroheme synthase
VATGHCAGEDSLDWGALARVDTLVVLMGAARLAEIAATLCSHGKPPETPVAVVENGTLPDQRGVVGRLGALRALIRESGIQGQAIIFVGEAAGRLAASTAGAASPLALAG